MNLFITPLNYRRLKHALISLFVFIILPVFTQAQDSVSIFDCYKLAYTNSPLIASFENYAQRRDAEQNIIKAKNLPQISLVGKASYQSDAINVELPLQGREPLSIVVDPFQYNAALSVEQKVYDGGIGKIRNNMAEIELSINTLQNQINLYKLNELVNAYYFGICKMQKNIESIVLAIDVLKEQQLIIKSGVRNGILKQSDSERISIELLKKQQFLVELESGRKKLHKGLGIILGLDDYTLSNTRTEFNFNIDSIQRLENVLFELQKNKIEDLSELFEKGNMPRFSAFGQTGYSYPGLNMFEGTAAPFYIVGARMYWNIFDGKMKAHEQEKLAVAASELRVQEEAFNRNIRMQVEMEYEELGKYDTLIAMNRNIVSSLSSVRETSSSEHKNGTKPFVEYMIDLNAEINARIELELLYINKSEVAARLALLTGNIDNE